MSNTSDDMFGYVAALVAVFAYGSYGVPIKATLSVQSVHPLVIQSYKTITMGFMSASLMLYNHDSSDGWSSSSLIVTKWGLLSGLLWVIGATFGIFAIRSAGMAQAIGTWASVMIAVNFIWGILIFQEPVASVGGALGAFLLLGLGLVGMSWYSAPQIAIGETDSLSDEDEMDLRIVTSTSAIVTRHSPTMRQLLPHQDNQSSYQHNSNKFSTSDIPPTVDAEGICYRQETHDLEDSAGCNIDTIEIFGRLWTLRAAGIAAAVVNGILNGSSMIPLHYAKQQPGYNLSGADYFMSFAIGALVANIVLWAIYYLVNVADEGHKGAAVVGGSFKLISVLKLAFAKLPDWHVRQLWLAGFSAGILLSIAMFGSILAVTYLGQGVGNSIVQAKIFVSGLWGIFYYKEITGRETISKWFASAAVTVTAIIWLTYERLTANGH